VQGFSLREFDRIGTPSLITRTTNDVTQLQMFAMVTMRMMVSAPIMAIGGVIMAVQQDAKLTWVLVVVIPIIALIVSVTAARGLPLFRAIQAQIDRINLVLRENLTGVRVIRAFDRIEHERRRFDEANLDLTASSIRVNKLMALLMVSFLFVMLPRASASAGRINEVFALQPEVRDPEKPRRANAERGHVEFRHVTYRYPGAEQAALSDICFEARPGEVTAIIGGTGCGKSTLVNLIPRFCDVESGSILVDGVDIRELSQEDLRSRLGFVPQKAVLFNDTIAANIRGRIPGGGGPGGHESFRRAEAAPGHSPRPGTQAGNLRVRRHLLRPGFQDRRQIARRPETRNERSHRDHRGPAGQHRHGRRSDRRPG